MNYSENYPATSYAMDSANDQVYSTIYADLPTAKSTRLVQLYPGAGLDPLRAGIRTTDLEKSDDVYVALSYTWGSSELPEAITCNRYLLPITRNLHSALLRLRNPTKIFTVWVDALSIDQRKDKRSLRERAQQVQMMNIIFAKAAVVVADIGEEPDSFTEFLERCRVLNSLPLDQWYTIPGGEGPSPAITPEIEEIRDNRLVWWTFNSIVSRPYWTRIWIVQEIALAKTVEFMIGNTRLAEESFYLSMFRIIDLLPMAEIGSSALDFWGALLTSGGAAFLRKILHMRQIFQHSEFQGMSILDLIDQLMSLDATDPRDRLFALYGMADWNAVPYEISVDYEQSPECLSVAISELFIHDNKPDQLFAKAAGADANIPSWCLDITTVEPQATMNLTLNKVSAWNSLYVACGETSPAVNTTYHTGKITCTGCCIETVVQVTGVCKYSLQELRGVEERIVLKMHEWNTEVTNWTTEFLQDLPTEEIFDSRWRTIIADLDTSRFLDPRRAQPQFSGCYRRWEQLIEAYASQDLARAVTLPREESFWNSLLSASGRRLGGTDHRRIGLLPAATRPGDEICIFAGIHVPFVVRSCSDHYKLVGHCYLHGMMDGQALELENRKLSEIILG